MGIAGSGKGTQGKMLADHDNMHLVSMGEVLRMYVTGDKRQRMLSGNLLADDEIIKIVDRVLTSLKDSNSVLLDGFPRTIDQARWLLNQANSGRFRVDAVIHLVADRQVVKKRLIARGRLDDEEKAIEERFRIYEQTTEPLLDWLKKQGVRVVDVNAEGSVEAVSAELMAKLKDS